LIGEIDMNKKLECDLLVAGGGIAGMCAAIAAARKGLSVVLINDRSVLGGNASSEISVGISGASHHGLNPAIYAKETGIVEEIRLRLLKYQQGGGYGKFAALDAVFFDMIYNEKNICLLLNTLVYGCEVSNRKINIVYARHSVNNNVYEISAQSFVDATGNGTLAYEAGAEYRIGREGKDEFGEFWAPDKADDFTMGNSIYFETEDAGEEVPFKAPDFAHDISKMDFLKDINKPENFRGLSCHGPHWAYEFGGQIDILNDHDETELELRKLIYGIWDYVKNSGKYPQAKTRRLKRVFAKAGTRESRRFIGDYILNENDIENKLNFKDSVAMGGWPMDIHAPLGIYDTLPASNFVSVTGTYNIPFRCLYSKDIDNLYLAGRNISATHIALGSTRVMATCGALGQAVGTAAYLGRKYNALPREIYKNYIDELQTILIDDDQSVLHIKEEIKPAGVSASSVKKYENISADDYLCLERDYALAVMADSERIDSIKIKLRCNKNTLLKYKLYTGIHPETYLMETLKKTLCIKLEKGFDDWVLLPIEIPVGADGKIYIVFEENRDIEIAVSERRTMGAVTMRMHKRDNCDKKNHDSVPLNEEKTGYTHCDHHYEKKRNILFKDILPGQNVFAPCNVINGYSRPYKTQNLWLADMDKPQTLTVIPRECTDVEELTVIFDNRLDIDEGSQLPSSLAREFDIKIYHSEGVYTISEKDNYKRLVKYSIKLSQVSKIEIIVYKTYGAEVGIYCVKVK
jgi:hypothetical protein